MGKKIHNLSRHRLYRLWYGIKYRCNPLTTDTKNYRNYAMRGITICNEWESDFMAFYNWAQSNGYREGLQLDRINNNGNYGPDNCRFVDFTTNNNNKRNNHYLEYNGKRQTIPEWARELNISEKTIATRIHYNLPIEKVLSTVNLRAAHCNKIVSIKHK